ncbi:galactose-1-phosphate uridylyltransferase [Hydrogenothermus marinus]|uniref:Galactose-1-phosphate uridylyltransferase n=1 Tax=Hydrogenothermus marinus TaxID=133270 RepID=A0A3M0BMD5_9AQUI|nr:galactose-1-phosphate uridylyltransferase [Hydrogenothermus marinus]RMA97706.1 UDPglucose--hexose-1-phosphate uridylyltransferase [Hydrogenothermus marinus]
MSEIRYDLINDEYVIIAPERLRKPDSFKEKKEIKEISIKDCPFCPGNEHLTPNEIYSLRDGNKWKVRVVPNLYKALKIEAPLISTQIGIFEKIEGFGAHEVIIDTPRHLFKMNDFTLEEYYNWLYVIRERAVDLKKDTRLIYLVFFKNQGKLAGASQSHPHTQLIALPIVPKSSLWILKRAFNYYKEHGRTIFEDIITNEEFENKRVIISTDFFIAFAPFASSFPFEIMIIPKKQKSSIIDLDNQDLKELSNILKKVIDALYEELGDFDFNISFGNPPINKNFEIEEFFEDIKYFWRFYIRIMPRIYRLAGFELSTNMKINPVLPEKVATLLRGVMENGI